MLRLQRQSRTSACSVVDQLERTNVLSLTPIVEEKESGLWERPVSFQHRDLLNVLFHGAPHLDGHFRWRWRRGTRVIWPPASIHTRFRFRVLGRRLPVGIFEGMEHQLVRLAWLCHFLTIYAKREISGRQLDPSFWRAEQSGFDHYIIFRVVGPLQRWNRMSQELGRDRHRARLD